MHRLLFWARLSIATALLTMGLKFGAWLLTGSVGLLSDALESIVNLLAATLAFFLLRLAHTPADEDHAFGHEKAEYFSSAAEGVLIMVAGLAIVLSAFERWLHPQPLAELDAGMLVAALAALANGIVGTLLLRAGRGHRSIALEADGHHLLSDVWTTVGILLALLLIRLQPQLIWLDPLAAALLAAYLFRTGALLLRRSGQGLMDAALPEAERLQLQQQLDAHLQEGWRATDIRTRQAGARRFIEFKLLAPPDLSVQAAHDVCDQLEAVLEREFQPVHISIHVEPNHCPLQDVTPDAAASAPGAG